MLVLTVTACFFFFFNVSVRLENVEPPYFAILLTSHCGFDLHFRNVMANEVERFSSCAS